MSLASLFKINTIGILLSLNQDDDLLKLNVLSFPFHLKATVFLDFERIFWKTMPILMTSF